MLSHAGIINLSVGLSVSALDFSDPIKIDKLVSSFQVGLLGISSSSHKKVKEIWQCFPPVLQESNPHFTGLISSLFLCLALATLSLFLSLNPLAHTSISSILLVGPSA